MVISIKILLDSNLQQQHKSDNRERDEAFTWDSLSGCAADVDVIDR